ncbi:CD3337/EF1877 family mobilome membrane protein [Paenibacillus pasadenensis]
MMLFGSAASAAPTPTPLPNLPTPTPSPTTGLQEGESPRDGVITGNFIESMMPPMASQGIERDYARYPVWNYTLDTDSSWYDPVTPAIMSVVNTEVTLDAMLVRFGIMVIEQAYTLDIFKYLGDFIATLIEGFRAATWDVLLKTMMIVIGLYIAFNSLIASRRSKSIDTFLKTFIVLVIAFLFFSYPKQILSTAVNVSSELSGAILTGGKSENMNGTVASIGNQIWKQQVLDPWYYMQFGSVAKGEVEGEKFLAYPKGNKIRDKNMEAQIKAGNTFMTEDSIYLRVIVIFAHHSVNIIVLVCLLIFASLIIVAQFVPIAMICLSPLVFTLALFPHFGLRIITKWIETVLGAIFFKVVISIFLSLYLQSSAALTKAFGSYYLLVVYLQLLIILALFFERKRITGMLTNLSKGEQAVAEVAGQKSNWGEQVGGALKKSAQVGLGLAAAAATGGSSAMMTGAVMGGKAGMMMQGVGIAQKFSDNRKNRLLSPLADTMLRDRFFGEKDRAEMIAKQTHQPVQYSPFVEQVMERESKGLPLFTDTQRQGVLTELKDIQKQGGDVNRYYNKPDAKAKTPEAYVEENGKYQQRMAQKHADFETRRQERMRVIDQAEELYQGTSEPDGPSAPPPLSSFSEGESVEQVKAIPLRTREIERPSRIPPDFASKALENPAHREEDEESRMPTTDHNERQKNDPSPMVKIPLAPAAIYNDPSYGGASYRREMDLLGQLDRAERNGDRIAADRYMDELQQLDPAAYGKYSNMSDIRQSMTAQAGTDLVERETAVTSAHVKPDERMTGDRVHPEPASVVMVDDDTRHLLHMEPPPEPEGQLAPAAPVDVGRLHVQNPFAQAERIWKDAAQAHRELADLELYKSGQGSEKSRELMPELHARVETRMDRSGLDLDQSMAAAQERVQSLTESMQDVQTSYDIKPKLFIHADGGSSEPVRVKSPAEYREDIHVKPLEKLNYVVKDVDVEFRQSVKNDFAARQQLEGVTPEAYVQQLYDEHLYRLKAHKTVRTAAQMEPEYRVDSKRMQALFVDATKRYEVAKQELGVDDGKAIQFRRKE